VDSDELVVVELSERERFMLRAALLEWVGPAQPTEQLALAMGFQGLDGLRREVLALRRALEDKEPLSGENWGRILIATEIVFASDVVGSGLDWPITTGIPDEEAIRLLRGLQRKMPRWRPSVQFTMRDGKVEIRDPARDR
jgi:hypothetical protein